MILRQGCAGNEPVMRLEVLDELDQVVDLPPEFDVAVDADGDDHVGLVGDDDVVDDLPVHVADLVVVGDRDVLKHQVVQVDCLRR